MTTDTVSGTPITFHRQGSGRLAVLLVHGFLDDHRVWDEVIDELADLAAEFISVDPPVAARERTRRARSPISGSPTTPGRSPPP
jgi:pimeloyl-ACP methyl ester carboxylesterase